jgi:hypothetical protein
MGGVYQLDYVVLSTVQKYTPFTDEDRGTYTRQDASLADLS